MTEECQDVIDVDFTEAYCYWYRNTPGLDEFLAPIDEQPWPEATYGGLNTFGNHIFFVAPSPSHPFLQEHWTAPYKKGDLIRVRNEPIQFIVESVIGFQPRALCPLIVAVETSMHHGELMVEGKWFWKVKFKRIPV